jgi:hypothetical protein
MTKRRGPLPSFHGISALVGGFLVGLEQAILHRRPPPGIVLEQEERSRRRTVGAISLELPPEDEVPRRHPPDDHSGARL